MWMVSPAWAGTKVMGFLGEERRDIFFGGLVSLVGLVWFGLEEWGVWCFVLEVD